MSLAMSKRVTSSGKVYAFEPGPISYGLLHRNIYANSQITGNNIEPIHKAVSDVNDKVELFINPKGESDNQVHKGLDNYEFGNEKKREKVLVEAISLDKFSEKSDLSNLKFIKMDTQRHEFFVIKGGRNFLKNKKNITLFVEYCPYLKAWEDFSQEEFYELIKDLHFDIYDSSRLEIGKVSNDYLKENYGSHFEGKYTDLILVK